MKRPTGPWSWGREVDPRMPRHLHLDDRDESRRALRPPGKSPNRRLPAMIQPPRSALPWLTFPHLSARRCGSAPRPWPPGQPSAPLLARPPQPASPRPGPPPSPAFPPRPGAAPRPSPPGQPSARRLARPPPPASRPRPAAVPWPSPPGRPSARRPARQPPPASRRPAPRPGLLLRGDPPLLLGLGLLDGLPLGGPRVRRRLLLDRDTTLLLCLGLLDGPPLRGPRVRRRLLLGGPRRFFGLLLRRDTTLLLRLGLLGHPTLRGPRVRRRLLLRRDTTLLLGLGLLGSLPLRGPRVRRRLLLGGPRSFFGLLLRRDTTLLLGLGLLGSPPLRRPRLRCPLLLGGLGRVLWPASPRRLAAAPRPWLPGQPCALQLGQPSPPVAVRPSRHGRSGVRRLWPPSGLATVAAAISLTATLLYSSSRRAPRKFVNQVVRNHRQFARVDRAAFGVPRAHPSAPWSSSDGPGEVRGQSGVP